MNSLDVVLLLKHRASIRLAWLAAICVIVSACRESKITPRPAAMIDQDWSTQRREMVEEQLKGRDISDARVLVAMEHVPRHEFVPPDDRSSAYGDFPLPIGQGQTISQPYIVAFMTESARLQPDHRVLEVGTGSGYQAAVLAELVREVYTVELLPELAARAEAKLKQLGYTNIHVRAGDGYSGWEAAAPFDAIVVTCGADHVPQPLVEQLKPGGRMIIPVGSIHDQSLTIIEKRPDGQTREFQTFPVRFVPLLRQAE